MSGGPQDEFFLSYVNDDPAIQFQFTGDVGKLRTALNVPVRGHTALVDTVYLALNAMRKARYATRGLLIVSDGEDNDSVYRMSELAAAAREARVPIFLIVPRDVLPREVSRQAERTARSELMTLAATSGGAAVAANLREQMLAAAETYAVAMRSMHTLYAAWRGEKTDGLKVKVKGVRRQPVLFYPDEAVPVKEAGR